MTRIGRISADNVGFSREIRDNPPDPRHPRSIPAISVLICRIRLIRVLYSVPTGGLSGIDVSGGR